MSPPTSPGPTPAVPSETHTPHHRVHLLSLAGKPGDAVTLPLAFSAPLRPDLIRRAVIGAQAARRQPHGTTPTAGRRHSVEWSGKGKGVARTPRLMESNRGAQAPNTVGGGPAHPPRTATIWTKKVNIKERQLAFRSALSATREAHLIQARGHALPEGMALPLVVEDPLEGITTAAKARQFLDGVKLWADVERAASGTHIVAGRGKRRGRMRHTPKSLLIVISQPGKARGFRNLAGVDVVSVGRLGTEDLAPGGTAGRLTIFSHAAVGALSERVGGPDA
ncbi:MAG: 50S ribosomal protein L4 [Thermoplasmata archaeon]|nr:50S ribosomal protein L4 [Thermoplasmata archaeon]